MTEMNWLYLSGHGVYVWSVVIFSIALVVYEVIRVGCVQRQCERIQQQQNLVAHSESLSKLKGDV